MGMFQGGPNLGSVATAGIPVFRCDSQSPVEKSDIRILVRNTLDSGYLIPSHKLWTATSIWDAGGRS